MTPRLTRPRRLRSAPSLFNVYALTLKATTLDATMRSTAPALTCARAQVKDAAHDGFATHDGLVTLDGLAVRDARPRAWRDHVGCVLRPRRSTRTRSRSRRPNSTRPRARRARLLGVLDVRPHPDARRGSHGAQRSRDRSRSTRLRSKSTTSSTLTCARVQVKAATHDGFATHDGLVTLDGLAVRDARPCAQHNHIGCALYPRRSTCTRSRSR